MHPGGWLRSGEGGGSVGGRSAACALLASLGSGPCSIHYLRHGREASSVANFGRNDDGEEQQEDTASGGWKSLNCTSAVNGLERCGVMCESSRFPNL